MYPQEVWCHFVLKWWRSSTKLVLGTWKQMSHTSVENGCEPSQIELHTSKLHRGEQKVIQQAATIINNLILEEVRRLAGKDKETDLKCLNIDSLISEINPLLWEFVSSITRPAYQQKTRSSETESTAHVKEVRRFNIICLLMCCSSRKYRVLFLCCVIGYSCSVAPGKPSPQALCDKFVFLILLGHSLVSEQPL